MANAMTPGDGITRTAIGVADEEGAAVFDLGFEAKVVIVTDDIEGIWIKGGPAPAGVAVSGRKLTITVGNDESISFVAMG